MESVIRQEYASAKFRRIGQGFCGSVWAAEEGTMAVKREDGGPGRSLLNDYNMHKLVLETASKASVCVPRWPHFVKNDDSWWWDMNLAKFPNGYTTCNVLCAERIPPLPREVRDRLIDRYCPPASVATIKANDADRDCLVRPYLGRRKIQNQARRGRNFFSLRNYPLHLNQAEELDLPILSYVHSMAEILAMMHWTAKVDANDVEFVLGGVQTQTETGRNEYTHSILGPHSLWVLDFDCCKPLTMDDAGIEQAAYAFLRNDPYFPRPATSAQSSDSTLWIEFRTRYLECSQNFVTGDDETCLSLPEKFIARVADMHEQGKERKTSGVIFDMSFPSDAASSNPSSPHAPWNRRQQVTSYSGRTPSFDVLAMQNLRLEDHLMTQAANETDEQTLKRLLSTKSAISTTSSFAERQQASAGQQWVFREIGTGSIGTVMEHPGTIYVYKFSLLDQNNKLWNNYLMGSRIQKSFSRNSSISGDVAIPQCMWFATAQSQFWSRYKQQIPASRNPGDVLCMERIFPLPDIIRNKIIDVFCQLDPIAREQAKHIASNKDCLIRPYLGRARVANSQSRLKAFSLRNYKLHLDQIQYLGLDAEELAKSMAKAMAIMHWDIRIDAADIEFVLGSSPVVDGTIPSPPEYLERLPMTAAKMDTFREITISDPNFKQRLVGLWLLDFDACTDISMDPSGVQKAVRAFLENEPYCPRPYGGSTYSDHLWRTFGKQYLATSASLLAKAPSEVAALPISFLTLVAKALAEPQPQSSSAAGGRGQGGRGQRGGRGHVRERAEYGSGQSQSQSPGGRAFRGGRGWRG